MRSDGGKGMPASLIFNVHNYIRFLQVFFAYSLLNINFKRVHMKLKIVALAFSVEKLNFYDFFYVLLLSYKPSNFPWAILPYATG